MKTYGGCESLVHAVLTSSLYETWVGIHLAALFLENNCRYLSER